MAIKNRPHTDKPKRMRKRRARTEVSSSSEASDSDSSSSASSDEQSGPVKSTTSKREKKNVKSTHKPRQSDSSFDVEKAHDDAREKSVAQQLNAAKAEEAFTSFYLHQMTTEFAEDLDKIRSAGDFSNKSIGMLVNALKQGSSCFSIDERIDVGRPIVARDL